MASPAPPPPAPSSSSASTSAPAPRPASTSFCGTRSNLKPGDSDQYSGPRAVLAFRSCADGLRLVSVQLQGPNQPRPIPCCAAGSPDVLAHTDLLFVAREGF